MVRGKASTASKGKAKIPAESSNRKVLDSFTIKRIHKTIKPGDCVLLRPSNPTDAPYVAKIEQIVSNSKGSNVKVHMRWFYRPEDTKAGRKKFHANKELFLSNHTDVNYVQTIMDTRIVRPYEEYAQSDTNNRNDYFWRLEYDCFNHSFTPDSLPVFCKCAMPNNPDDMMLRCEKCHDWFHPRCVGLSDQEIALIDHYFCESCEQDGGQNVDTPISPSGSESQKRRRLKKGD